MKFYLWFGLIFLILLALGVFLAKRLLKSPQQKEQEQKDEVSQKVNQNIRKKFSMKNQEYLNQLNPAVRAKFEAFIVDINKMGYEVVITSGYRSFQKQAELKKADARNAAPGFSSHNYGTALDFVLVKGGKMIQKNAPRAEWLATGVPQLGINKYGMRWGGDFPGYPDHVHFDLNNKYDTKKLYAMALKQFGSADRVRGNELDLSKIA